MEIGCVADFMSFAELRVLCEVAQSRAERKRYVHATGSLSGERNAYLFEDLGLAHRIFLAARRFLPERVGRDRLAGVAAGMRLYTYRTGQYWREHTDGQTRSGSRVSHVSLLVYLSDDYEGGKTCFPTLGLEFAPRAGTALWFAQTLPHRAAPVTRGEKMVLRADAMYDVEGTG